MFKLYIKQKAFKITDHYTVIDEEGRDVYKVDQDFKIIGNRVNVAKIDGTKSFVLEKKLWTMMPQYEVVFSDGKSFLIKENFKLFRKDITLTSNDYNLSLSGNYWDMNFIVKDNDKVVGEIDKAWLTLGDVYEITVLDKTFEEELLALLIVVDAIKDDEDKRASN